MISPSSLQSSAFRLKTLTLPSFAKLNLYLEVLKKRPDNYHDIETVFERIDLCDKIILTSRRADREIRISCSSPEVPKDSSNLCYRSAKLLQEEYGINEGLDIAIIKRIPVGAGLGGGSSNAACVLAGLNKFWGLRIPQKGLLAFAKSLGCDVPFFICNLPFARGVDRGDTVRPLKVPRRVRFWHLVVVPKIMVSTPSIYRKWDADSGLTRQKGDVNILTLGLEENKPALISRGLFNSLEKVTGVSYPEVGCVRGKLAKLGLKSILMSGSGPAVFGICSSRKEAVSLGRKLRKQNSSWRVFVSRTC